jgi:hypothetical protein
MASGTAAGRIGQAERLVKAVQRRAEPLELDRRQLDLAGQLGSLGHQRGHHMRFGHRSIFPVNREILMGSRSPR